MILQQISATLFSLAFIRCAYGRHYASPLALDAQVSTGASTPTKGTKCAGGQTVNNAACCAWFPVLEDILPNMFDNECGDDAHGALRLSFHDAISFSPSKGGGGADGSIITFNDTELNYAANDGLQDPVATEIPFIAAHNVTAGDFIQFAAGKGITSISYRPTNFHDPTAVSLSLCPGAPQVGFMMGRPTAKAPAPDGLVPEPFAPADVVALLASHSVAGADTVDPTIPGTPFDSTPSLFDTQIFIEVQLKGTLFPGQDPGQGEVKSAVEGTMRLQSDSLIARDNRTSCAWQTLAGQFRSPIVHMVDPDVSTGNLSGTQSAFKSAFERMAIIGHKAADLIDCSDVIPAPIALSPVDGPHLPAGQNQKDIEQACTTAPFPTFTAQPGPATSVAAM
ncbi:Peroxidase [Mycena sanguinolenta]|uniref:Peroxidase n=1 Tax=Mycena sanguinolenta TaxID=230812 RepID=A0A8H7DJ08_9AGAR|nr:Peroxidase [Mycena sanguinolenta]